MSEVGWFRRHFGWRVIKVDPLLDDKTETLRRLNWMLLISLVESIAYLLGITLTNHPTEHGPDAVEAVVVFLVIVGTLAGARSLVTHDILKVTWVRDDDANPDQTDR